ncbi:cilia- and flagella-associated protein 299-like [Uranotaenia lowii]|uniref:cilia- and flagella-associated protein 299-like n=1 Tax=Uranotaenia lowii TaxID=190385 RepID=UPI00247A9F1C|nr:cilia- and flagella-associated protein 299-like [Uranotaenia lowii]
MQLLEEDLRILECPDYQTYLKNSITTQDTRYLGHRLNGILLHQTGYQSLDRVAFESRRHEMGEMAFVAQGPNVNFSKNLVIKSQFLRELASRERPNQLGILSTIIFIRYRRGATELSGYIDFKAALKRVDVGGAGSLDWRAIFSGEQILCPSKFDLSFYNSQSDRATHRSSRNFRVMFDRVNGLVFQNVHDRKNIYPDPIMGDYGTNTTRSELESDVYDQVALYDHVVRKNY